ncbi:N-acetyltransferase ESCO1 [Pelodytes ibericus]
MASQKRKPSPRGPAAKRQKHIKDGESPSVTPKKRTGASIKSDRQCSQSKKVQTSKRHPVTTKKKNGVSNESKAKPSVLKKTPEKPKVKKTILKSIVKTTARKPVNKRKSSELKKPNILKKIPAKETALKTSKAVTMARKSAVSHTAPDSALKGSKKPRVVISRGAMVQNKKALSKTQVSTRSKAPVSVKENQCNTSSKKSGKRIALKPLVQSRRLPVKSSIKLAIKQPAKNSVKETGQNKISTVELLRKSGRLNQGKINSCLLVQKPAEVKKLACAETKENCKEKLGKQLGTARKPSNKSKITASRSTSLKPCSKRQSLPKKRSKGTDKVMTETTRAKNKTVKVNQKSINNHVCKISHGNGNKANSDLVPSSVRNEDVPVSDAIELCNTPIPNTDVSSASLTKKVSTEINRPKSKVASAPSEKRKASSIKPLVKNKVKRQKTVPLDADRSKPTTPHRDDSESKRVSILDLCNEIAGEIESDTVEVMKEAQSCEAIPKEETLIEEKKEDIKQETVQTVSTEEGTSKCFFPSKKSLQTKHKLDRKTPPPQRNTKWNKIKLKKRNNLGQTNMPRNRTVLPNLDSFKAKSVVSNASQPLTTTLKSPRNLDKESEMFLPIDNKVSKPNLPDIIKKTRNLLAPKQENKEAANGVLEQHIKNEQEIALDEGFRLHLDSSPENTPLKREGCQQPVDIEAQGSASKQLVCSFLTGQMAASAEKGNSLKKALPSAKSCTLTTEVNIQKELKKLKESEKDSNKQPIIDAGQKRFGALSCNVCGMLYTASNPEDETQHLLFHNQFVSAVKYVGWKKERLVAEYPDGKVIMVLPDDPKYALKKVEEIREMVDNDLGFQQVPLRLHSRTKTLLFISSDKKVVGCLISEHIQWGYRVIDDKSPESKSEKEQAICERVKAWCCSTSPEPAICGISRIWVFSMMRRRKIASRMLECLRNHFIYGSYLNKDEIAFSDPTPDGKLFATHYCGTSQFLVYNFVSGQSLS